MDVIVDGTPPSLSANQQGKTNKIIIKASDELSGLNSVLKIKRYIAANKNENIAQKHPEWGVLK